MQLGWAGVREHGSHTMVIDVPRQAAHVANIPFQRSIAAPTCRSAALPSRFHHSLRAAGGNATNFSQKAALCLWGQEQRVQLRQRQAACADILSRIPAVVCISACQPPLSRCNLHALQCRRSPGHC